MPYSTLLFGLDIYGLSYLFGIYSPSPYSNFLCITFHTNLYGSFFFIVKIVTTFSLFHGPVYIQDIYIMFKKKADLENMLLEAAGRTSNSVKKRKTLRKSSSKDEGSYSDGGNESKDEDSNDKADDSAKKPSISQTLVPIKKRLDPTKILPQQNDNDNDEGEASDRDGGESSNESDVGSDLYKDEDDKERLAKMTELEREMILSDPPRLKMSEDLLRSMARCLQLKPTRAAKKRHRHSPQSLVGTRCRNRNQ